MHQPAIQYLPNELLGIILELTENISAVSLVSRQFYQVAFPLVHRTLVLSDDTRVKTFIDRVRLSEQDNSSLRISQALRCLIVSEKNYARLFGDSLVLAQFRDIIPQLVNLELLSWRTSQQLNTINLLTDFQRYCTKLRSLDLKAVPRQLLADNIKILGFRNLTHLVVEHQDDPDDDSFRSDPAPGSLLEVIRSSPLLRKLVLRLHGRAYRGPEETLNVNRFFQDLDTTLPHLRHLELWSGAKLEWNSILHSAQESDPVRTFFMGSSKIETLIIDWGPKSRIDNPSLSLLKQMFPALRHFTGPEQICAILLASDLRPQLESLRFVRTIHSSDWTRQNAHVNVVDATTELPQLRSLIFWVNFVYDEYQAPEPELLVPAMLMQYLRAAPILESLEIGSFVTLPQILEPISTTITHANLRRLTIRLRYNARPMARNKDETIVKSTTQLAMTCPQLEQLTIHYSRPPLEVYQFERDGQGCLKRILMNGREPYTIPSH